MVLNYEWKGKLQNVTCFTTLPEASRANHPLTTVIYQLPKAKPMISGDHSEGL